MTAYLLLLQFAFLYFIIFFTGLFNYGSDMKSIAGKLYLITLFTILISIFIFKRKAISIPLWLNRAILIIGGISGLILYRDLHFNFWDEHSLKQSILMSVLGISSFMGAFNGAQIINQSANIKPQSIALAMLIISITWLTASQFPMTPIFLISIILLLAISTIEKTELNLKHNGIKKLTLEHNLIFIAMMDITLIIWDYQVNSIWGLYIFISFAGAAIMMWLKPKLSINVFALILIVNFVVTIIYPAYVLFYLHSLISGLILGVVLSRMYTNNKQTLSPQIFITCVTAVVWGVMFAYAFYANLAYSDYRAIFLLPIIGLLLKKTLSKKAPINT